MPRAKGIKDVSIQIRASFQLLRQMHCYTKEQIIERIYKLYGYKVQEYKWMQWTQTISTMRMVGREKFAHPDIIKEYVMLHLKQAIVDTGKSLATTTEAKELNNNIKTLIGFLQNFVELERHIDTNDNQQGMSREQMVQNLMETILGGKASETTEI